MGGSIVLMQASPATLAGPPTVAIGSGLLALVLSLLIWPVVRFAITIAHEGAHALTASAMGGEVDSICVYRNHDSRGRGVTTVRDVGPFGKFFTTLAGYLGPSTFGIVGAILLGEGKTTAVLWLSLFFLFLALLNSGNTLGAVAMAATGAAIAAIIRYASPAQQVFLTHTWIWLLLYGGFGHVLALQHERATGKDTGSDAYRLRVMTFLPASLWSGLFWLASLAALLYGGGLLLGIVHVGT